MNPRTLVRDLAGATTAKDYFARDEGGALYVYRGGVYRPEGELLVRQRVKHLLLDQDCSDMWSRARSNEIIEFIALDVPELPERPSTDLVNLENGLLNVRTRQLFPHSPEFLSTIRIPIAFGKEAACPEIEKLIGEVFPEDAIPLAWEILGDLLTPDRSVQKAICLLGEGGNGKSVFLDLATRFVGAENLCHLSLPRLEADRFSAARLYGTLANICPDLPGERLESSAMFKAITGCEEVKYRDSFEFAPFARLLFSANRLPAGHDASQAFFDRWLIAPFQDRFRQTRPEVPRRILEWRLCSPTELSGALNKALDGLVRVRKCFRFTEPRESRAQLRRYQAANDALAAWLDEHTVADPEVVVPQSDIEPTHHTAASPRGGRRRSRCLGADFERCGHVSNRLNGPLRAVALGYTPGSLCGQRESSAHRPSAPRLDWETSPRGSAVRSTPGQPPGCQMRCEPLTVVPADLLTVDKAKRRSSLSDEASQSRRCSDIQ